MHSTKKKIRPYRHVQRRSQLVAWAVGLALTALSWCLSLDSVAVPKFKDECSASLGQCLSERSCLFICCATERKENFASRNTAAEHAGR